MEEKESQEPRYTPLFDSQDEIHPDVAQDPDELAQKQLPQVPLGQETEPSKKVKERNIGKPRRKTVGTITEGVKILKAQDSFRVDVTQFDNEATGQIEFTRTSDVLPEFQKTGVLVTDFPERPIAEAEAIDPSEVNGPQLSTERKQKGGASSKYTPVNNPGSRIIPG